MTALDGADPIVRTTTTDGVATLWCDVPGDTFGCLVVGVGARDLSPTVTGLHHLVEHLVMRRVGPVVIDHNAESSPDSLAFYATGDADDVVDFLQRVGAAVASMGSVTAEEVDRERSTIRREVGLPRLYSSLGPFSARFGADGLGVADVDHAALYGLTVADVHAFAGHWLVAGNMRLVLTVEPPAGLTLGVPTGSAPERPAHPAPLPGDLPALTFTHPSTPPVLNFLVTADDGVRGLAAEVVEQALSRRLRHADGEVYSVDLGSWWLRGGTTLWSVVLDPAPDRAAAVVVDACRTLRSLAADGPDAELLEHSRAVLTSRMRSADGRRGWLGTAAESELLGRPRVDRATYTLQVSTATGEQVRSVVADAMTTLLALVPAGPLTPEVEEALADELGFVERSIYPAFEGTGRELRRALMSGGVEKRSDLAAALSTTGSVHKGRRFGPRRGEEIWLGPRQLVVPSVGAFVTVDDLVLVGVDDDDDVELMTRTGGSLVINPAHYRGTEVPWARFVSSVPPHVVRHKPGVGTEASA